MFKVPDWETDVPKANVIFTKKAISKNSKKQDVETKPNHIVEKSSQDNTKILNIFKPTATKGKSPQKKKKSKKHKQKSNASEIKNDASEIKNDASEIKNEEIFTKESEGIEMDEVLLNAKKQKLNDIYEKEDCEELLFGDAKEIESVSTHSENNNKKIKPDLSNGNTQNNKSVKKRKHEGDANSEINRITVNTKKIKLKDDKTAVNGQSKRNKNMNAKVNKNRIENNGIEENDDDIIDETSQLASTVRKKQSDIIKKEKFKKLLEQNNIRSPINTTGNNLRYRMMERLKAAQFRYLNEKLYTSSGTEAQEIFQSDPAAFKTYHQGYQLQVKKWPVNPLDVIVKKIKKLPNTFVVADMGCGEAALSKRVQQKVHSFDLVASAPGVVACDMARTPLLKSSVDVVVYCLALMGTELTQYLMEANRVLKTGGQLLIAEVESRFDDVNSFIKEVERLGFKLKTLDKEQSVFFFLHFVKVNDPPVKKNKLPVLTLKPCLYKRR